VVVQERPEGQEVDPAGGAQHDPFRPADDLVVLDPALVAVELLARLEGDGVDAALGIGELNLVTGPERAVRGSDGDVGGFAHARKAIGREGLPRAVTAACPGRCGAGVLRCRRRPG
jgi:hypothetical protein